MRELLEPRVVVLLLFLGVANPAYAQPSEDLNLELPPLARVDDDPLPWGSWLAAAPLAGVTIALTIQGSPNNARWKRVGPIDDAFGALTARTDRGRRQADRASDVFLYTTIAAPILDAVLWPAREGASRSRSVYRLLALDSLSFSVSGLFVASTKRVFRRARPFDERCRAADESPDCASSSRFKSFISGHTTAAFTGASLVCAHQRLRGRTLAGHLECATAMAMAVAAGGLRIAAEQHFVSDVIAGAVVGFLSGYILPLLLYRAPAEPAPRETIQAW